MPKTHPGVVVTGLTLGAMAVVGLLAYQAGGAEPRAAAGRTATAPAATPSPTTSATPAAPALPADSGTGRRVVYQIGAHQVWLVDPKKTPPVVASFKVTAGSVDPAAGSYTVYSRSSAASGADGNKIEHVVRFGQQTGTVFGFSAEIAGATASPDPKAKTGGIRSTRADGQTLWDFAPNGTRVIVLG